jgi:hypothetical protein
MRVATFDINNVNERLPSLLTWLAARRNRRMNHPRPSPKWATKTKERKFFGSSS